MKNSSSRSAFLPGNSGGSEAAFGAGDTTIPSSMSATGSGKIMSERSDPSTRRSRLTGEGILPGAARRIDGVPVSTAAGGATPDVCGGAAGGVRRGAGRYAGGGTTRSGTGGTLGGGTRCTIGVAPGGSTRDVIGDVTVGDETRCGIGGATGVACGFPTMMRSRHLGHRMHAPFAPFSNASFRRYSVMQKLHWTTMPMARPVPRRIPCPIIGRYSVKGKCRRTATAILLSTLACGPLLADDLPALRQGMWKFLRTVDGKRIEIDVATDGQASKEVLIAQRTGDCAT